MPGGSTCQNKPEDFSCRFILVCIHFCCSGIIVHAIRAKSLSNWENLHIIYPNIVKILCRKGISMLTGLTWCKGGDLMELNFEGLEMQK